MTPRIVVGVDGSAGCAEALRWAVRESRLGRGDIVAVLAWDGRELAERGAVPDPLDLAGDVDHGLSSFVASVVGAEAAASIECQAVDDAPVRALGIAAGDDLLVVGARGLGGFRGLLLGSVSQACVHHAAGPVAVVRVPAGPGREPRDAPGTDRIVVGVDGHAGGHAALAWAADEAVRRGARLAAVHTWHLPFTPTAPVVAPIDQAVFEDSANALLDVALERVDLHGLSHPVQRFVVLGGAAGTILEVAREADLVVVGTQSHSGLAKVLLGSVSSQVTHHATCPVVVVPPPTG